MWDVIATNPAAIDVTVERLGRLDATYLKTSILRGVDEKPVLHEVKGCLLGPDPTLAPRVA